LVINRIYWELGGQLRSDPEFARAQFLEAARDGEGMPWQARAFEWLGRWYAAVARDGARARKCFSRALALDPALVSRGWLFGWLERWPCVGVNGNSVL
jgi:Tfp pilus assembly protein PilF